MTRFAPFVPPLIFLAVFMALAGVVWGAHTLTQPQPPTGRPQAQVTVERIGHGKLAVTIIDRDRHSHSAIVNVNEVRLDCNQDRVVVTGGTVRLAISGIGQRGCASVMDAFRAALPTDAVDRLEPR